MPRPKKPGSAEPKKRSRNGCWPCKNRKIKCGEERPRCQNCERQGEACDYSIRLNWEGRTKRKGSNEHQLSPPLKIRRSTSGKSDTTIRESSPNPNGGPVFNQFSSSLSNPTFQVQSQSRDQISTAQLSRIRDQGSGPYPSPADSHVESPPPNGLGVSNGNYQHPSEMPPPFSNIIPPPNYYNVQANQANAFVDHQAKKMRLSPSADRPDVYQKQQGPTTFVPGNGFLNAGSAVSPPSLPYQSGSPSNFNLRVPPTPAASTVSEENHNFLPQPSPQYLPQESPDFRRLSVKSLLSDDSPADSTSGSDAAFPGKLHVPPSPNTTQKTMYGVDKGFPDLDSPNNQDSTALNGVTPTLPQANLDLSNWESNNDLVSGFGFGVKPSDTFQEGAGYYEKPVNVTIHKSLEPLPSMLKDNPMNLLYFHHFLNHTARILVPHDCSENPFKSILPGMAVKDENLLNLLLTYSASHRAKVLNHREPTTRIATWMSGVFPALRKALDDPNRQISNSNLATAIMLASLQILNPNTFGKAISWQQHLSVARQMILARGGANSVHREDKVSYFLTRWFAYLDVLGSLSGGKNDRPLFGGHYWANDNPGESQDHQIDCLLGFTSRCVSILANIAELAKTCDGQRIDTAGNVRPDWEPSQEISKEAAQLLEDLDEARHQRFQGCPHRRASTNTGNDDLNLELFTTNEAFHHAGFIHVKRRILGKPSNDSEVQFAVREIVSALYKVREGGAAEGCLLFPMFTAGCEAQEKSQRMKIMERLNRMEGLGMSTVRKARLLMEKVWETGRPWETLVTRDAFLG